ncbi:MAG: hypothetical protein OCU16_07335 [Candidatus Methanospirare jalkutatii]|nr:hypothetical protein [Candidatus Methanospirare jalkutatii]UYZ40511.1 MAG: hypothetical protein N2V74_02120 [Candidatus Methanospirare jalkutatii]UYZ40817.1 MAG: hypothetical protein N2V74_03740 [Candidatus Methanospirare jalkutatii]
MKEKIEMVLALAVLFTTLALVSIVISSATTIYMPDSYAKSLFLVFAKYIL